MRRAVLTLGGTIAGLAALFSFKTHVPGITPVAATSTPTGLSVSAPPMTSSNGSSPAASSSASASPSKTAKKTAPKASSSPTSPAMTQPTTPIAPATTPARTTPTTAPSSAAPSKKPTTAPSTTAPTKSAPSGTFTGTDEQTNYGPVQVQLTVSGGKITAANDVQQPSDSIGANAVSQLNSEVLQAQSANVQAVSGATYTSDGYIASLQQAVDQAGL
jgi:uncharacterized protein with FMN-binding domain